MLDPSKINADLKALKDLYLEKGYWNVRVQSQVLDSAEQDEATLVFEIMENDKREITKIGFLGNENLKKNKLLDEMETAEWALWRFWSARSKYRPRILEDDLEKLKEVYRNEGFLGIRIEQKNVRIIPYASPIPFTDQNLELQIEVLEGNRSFFGNNKITGNVVIDTDELIKKSMIIQGDPYSPAILSKERSRIKRIYGEKGYLDAYVRVTRTPNLNTNQICLLYTSDAADE